jgi:hypothetical protein
MSITATCLGGAAEAGSDTASAVRFDMSAIQLLDVGLWTAETGPKSKIENAKQDR